MVQILQIKTFSNAEPKHNCPVIECSWANDVNLKRESNKGIVMLWKQVLVIKNNTCACFSYSNMFKEHGLIKK